MAKKKRKKKESKSRATYRFRPKKWTPIEELAGF